ncbi:hypothetical protein QYM36_008295 [Artemia franciscana]|nr:hypothetical protein QYM36_008295 [Artemia franciscana]
MDGADVDGSVHILVNRIQEMSVGYEGRLELNLIGGFADPRAHSERLSISILHAFHRQMTDIDLVLACIGDLNTTYRGGIAWPFIYGVGVYIKTGEIFPAIFPDKGPDMSLRTARIFTNGQQQLMDIYDCGLGLMRLGPFTYPPLRGVDLWLQQSDDLIVSHLSPSPEVEPPNFSQKIRAALNFIRKHQFPAITVFPDGRPKFYRKIENGGMWIEIQY